MLSFVSPHLIKHIPVIYILGKRYIELRRLEVLFRLAVNHKNNGGLDLTGLGLIVSYHVAEKQFFVPSIFKVNLERKKERLEERK